MYHLANFELKRIKTAKVVSKWPFLASCMFAYRDDKAQKF